MNGWEIALSCYLAIGTFLVWIVFPEVEDDPERLRRQWWQAWIAAIIVAIVWLPAMLLRLPDDDA